MSSLMVCREGVLIQRFIISLTHMNVNREALQLHAICKKPYFYYKSCESLYQVGAIPKCFSKL